MAREAVGTCRDVPIQRQSTLLCLHLCLTVLTVQSVWGQTDRVWRRERGTRALKAGQHPRQEGSALVAVMVSGLLLQLCMQHLQDSDLAICALSSSRLNGTFWQRFMVCPADGL